MTEVPRQRGVRDDWDSRDWQQELELADVLLQEHLDLPLVVIAAAVDLAGASTGAPEDVLARAEELLADPEWCRQAKLHHEVYRRR